MKHVVFFSGGIGSYFTAKRVIDRHGKSDVELLFTDTLIEDEDLYRFIDEAANYLEVKLVKIQDGRTPWEVAKDKRFLPNSRIAQCSYYLKQKLAKEYIKNKYKPDECTLYLGIDFMETHRAPAIIKNWKPYSVEFPMCEEPFIQKDQMLKELEDVDGIEIPRLYKLGFSHNNCGGFCFKAGIGHFKNLLEKMPNRYLAHEKKEEELRVFLNRDDISILRRTRKGVKKNITLKELRLELEAEENNLTFFEKHEFGGCGCFMEELDEPNEDDEKLENVEKMGS